ncbi:DEAD/DEAH box helicase family protein [Amycolatopsis sp. CA-161197]|uniref:DEAD/DEAH box helicase family protein n=1 Tax=Amycolatopsis sp. CA-161197 TaxID=3239922 RepID=UPI003D8A955C
MRDEPAFQRLSPKIDGNARLREPQTEAYDAVVEHFDDIDNHREAGIVLPVGCGKSGLITLAPFALKVRRVLVIAPGLRIANQLLRDFNPTARLQAGERLRALNPANRATRVAAVMCPDGDTGPPGVRRGARPRWWEHSRERAR